MNDANFNVTSLVALSYGMGDVERYVYHGYGVADFRRHRLDWMPTSVTTEPRRDLTPAGNSTAKPAYTITVTGNPQHGFGEVYQQGSAWERRCTNLYEYVFNAPLSRRDPQGLQPGCPRALDAANGSGFD